MELKIKWLAEVDKPQFNKFTYTQEMVDNLIKNTKKKLPMPLYDFTNYVDAVYLHETAETQAMLEKEPTTNVGLVTDIIQEGTNVFIIVETENDDFYIPEKDTFSIAMKFDDEIDGFGSHEIERFYVSDELIRGQLITELIKQQIKDLPEAEKKAMAESKERMKKLGKRQRREQAKKFKKELKAMQKASRV